MKKVSSMGGKIKECQIQLGSLHYFKCPTEKHWLYLNSFEIFWIDTSLWISGGIKDTNSNLLALYENSEFIIIGEGGNVTTSKGPDLPVPLSNHAMVSINNTLSMIIGGLSSIDTGSFDVFFESALTFWYD